VSWRNSWLFRRNTCAVCARSGRRNGDAGNCHEKGDPLSGTGGGALDQ
jgi:hypothetical protein